MQIRQAYRNLLTKTHPDKGGDAEQFERIKAAYEVLADPEKVTILQVLTRLPSWCISLTSAVTFYLCRGKSTTGLEKYICQ